MKNCALIVLAVGLTATSAAFGNPTLDYAQSEATRLLSRVGKSWPVVTEERGGLFMLRVGDNPTVPEVSAVKHDGFVCRIEADRGIIAAPTAKGVLNGVYMLAEEAGFAFVYPGAKGELAPARMKPLKLGERTVNPRFAHRGFFDVSAKCGRYSWQDWIEYLAKLRFNAVADHGAGTDPYCDLFAKLGFRLEIGGHWMSPCLPRELFKTKPELFRMFQPEDFNGKRMPDSNYCASNPEAQAILASNYVSKCRRYAALGYRAVHAWADDLPGGGWCMCSRCRSMNASDQSQLAMNVLARALRKSDVNVRVPSIGYHDTLFPSESITPDPKCFFLFAPRERCYAHALNDSSCPLNREHFAALQAWARRYRNNTDGHTFEYYTDTMLCRGHAVYLPDVLIGDGDAYAQNGVESWMTVHIGGPQLAIEWNLLTMAKVAWEAGHDRETLTQALVRNFPAGEREIWNRYLLMRAAAYETALKVCKVPHSLYFDYRFMPELGGADGRQLIADLKTGWCGVIAARQYLQTERGKLSDKDAWFVDLELSRSLHEPTDLQAMVEQQKGLYEIAEWRSDGDEQHLKRACAQLEKTMPLLKQACDELRPLALKPGQKDSDGSFDICYYLYCTSGWLIPEIQRKIENYRKQGF